MLVLIEEANRASQMTWRRVLRRARLTCMIRLLSSIVVGVAVMMGGEIPTPRMDDPGVGEDARPSKKSGSCRRDLAVKESSGSVHDIQVDFIHRLSSRWRGPAAIVRGAAWVGDRGLTWMPGERSRARAVSSWVGTTWYGFRRARSAFDRAGWSSRPGNTVKPGYCSDGTTPGRFSTAEGSA